MKKILITGGCGYLGSVLSNFLSEKKYKVYVIDNLSNSSNRFLNKEVIFKKINVNNLKKISKLFNEVNFESVFHLSAKKNVVESEKNPSLYYKENVTYTTELFKLVNKSRIKNFFFVSSAAVYGNSIKKINSRSIPKPISIYGKTKLIAEKKLINFKKKNTNLIIFRLFNLAGADEKKIIGNTSSTSKDVFTFLIEAFIFKKNFKLFGSNFKTTDGSCKRNFIHVSDVVNIFYLIHKKIE